MSTTAPPIVPYRPDRGAVLQPSTGELQADHALALQGAQRREEARTEALITEDKARRALATAIEARESADRYLRQAWTTEEQARALLAERLTADHAAEAQRRASIFPAPVASVDQPPRESTDLRGPRHDKAPPR